MNHRKVIWPTNRAGLLALLGAVAILAAVLTSTPMATQAQAPAVTGVSVQPSANAGGLDVSWATHPGETKDYRVAWAPQGENFRKRSNTDWNAYPTGTSLTITGLQGGATYKVKVRARFDEGPSSPWSAVKTATARPANGAATGQPTVSGAALVGETLTARTSAISDDNGMTSAVFNYQWVRTGAGTDNDVAGATGSTYNLSADDLSHTIKVRVSFTDDDGYSEALTSESTGIVLRPPNATPSGLPVISGTLEVGETLTADTSGISDLNGMTDAVFAFQWIRSAGGTDTDIPDATGSTYTIVSSDAGNKFKIRVSFTDDDGYAESVTSQATDILLVVQRQTEVTLVSNAGQTTTSTRYTVGPIGGAWYSRALKFTAGSATNGYTITEVSIRLKRIRAGAVPRVSIYTSVSAPGTIVALPGAIVFPFTNPGSFSNGLNTFTAPANSTLAGSADYFVVIENAATGDAATNRYDIRVTNQGADDTGSATGWSLGDTRIDRSANSADWVDTSEFTIPQVAIKGAAIESIAPALSTATVDGTSLVLTYDEPLDEDSAPAASAYSVTVGSNSAAPSAVAVSGSTVTLTLAKAAASGDTVTLAYTVPSSNPVQDAVGNDAAALSSQAVTNEQRDPVPGVESSGWSHNGLHDAAKDITLDFSSTTSSLETNLTTTGDYKISGIHMDADYVYIALRGTQKGIFKFDRSSGSIVKKRSSLSFNPQGLAGSSSKLYTHSTGGGINVYTLELVAGTAIVVSCCVPGNNFTNVYGVGDVRGSGSASNITFLGKRTNIINGVTRPAPFWGSQQLSDDVETPHISGNEMEPHGFTVNNIDGLDTATDGTTVFIEDGSGSRAVGFTTEGTRTWFKDVDFGGDNYDGLFFDGTNLWSVDVDSLDATDETLVLRAFVPGGPTPIVAATVSAADLAPALRHEVDLRQSAIEYPFSQDVIDDHTSGTPPVLDVAALLLDYYEQSVFPNPTLIAQDGGANIKMWAMEGVIPQGIWGDSNYLWVVDNRTKGVYALDRDDFDAGELTLSHPFLVADDFYFETPPGSQTGTDYFEPVSYYQPTAVYHDGTTLWVSEDRTGTLMAYGLENGVRDAPKDISLAHDGCDNIATGMWGDGTSLWVGVVPTNNTTGCRWWRILKINLATSQITQPSGFTVPNTLSGRGDIWSDGSTMWVHTDAKIVAYNLANGNRSTAFDINLDNHQAEGMWSDGVNLYVGDESTSSISVYQLTTD